jgi:tripartite-type tricarboxylate transporter receptor subunit TctC
MPPNVPAERVNAIRRAFDATMKDKEYLVEAEKLKLEIDPMTGEDIAKMLEQIAKTPADVVARVRTAYEGR